MRKKAEKQNRETMGIAWLVRWVHSNNKKEIVNVISGRKKIEDIIDIAKDIYIRERLYFSEKMYLSHYLLGATRRREWFGMNVPIYTSYQSQCYRELMKNIEKNGLDKKETKDLMNCWVKQPQYVTIGYSPFLEIYKVSNLCLHKNDMGNEIIEWDEPVVGGSFKKEKYEFKK